MQTKKYKIIRATTVPMSLKAFCNGMLKELSVEYEVVALSSPGKEMAEIAEREGVRVIGVPMARHISLLNDVVALWRIIGVFRKERPTIVHSMTPKAGLLCMVAAWMTRVPIRIHTFTGLVFPTATGLKRKILMTTDRLTCLCATNIIPEGEGVKSDLQNNKITRKPLKVLGFGNVRGIDLEYYKRRTEVLAVAEKIRKKGVFTFLFVGRIVADKGINELCAAFNTLHREFPNTCLRLVGLFEDDLDPVTSETRSLIDNQESIECVGAKYGDDLLACYASADCFVMPSYREGFPNTVIEAGAMDLPSIVTDINGSREIIVEGQNGLIVPPKDQRALLDAMKRMLIDDNARNAMSANARNMIADRFEQGFVRKCLYDYYRELLDKRG